jgi:hypothetical protein
VGPFSRMSSGSYSKVFFIYRGDERNITVCRLELNTVLYSCRSQRNIALKSYRSPPTVLFPHSVDQVSTGHPLKLLMSTGLHSHRKAAQDQILGYLYRRIEE